MQSEWTLLDYKKLASFDSTLLSGGQSFEKPIGVNFSTLNVTINITGYSMEAHSN